MAAGKMGSVLGIILLCFWTSVWSQAYPSRAVHVVVPFAVGGPADLYGRFIGAHGRRNCRHRTAQFPAYDPRNRTIP